MTTRFTTVAAVGIAAALMPVTGDAAQARSAYRVNCRTPRSDNRRNVSPANVAVPSPASIRVYAFSKSIVRHAARVQASVGPAVSVWPDSENVPLHTLQSALVDRRPSANVRV